MASFDSKALGLVAALAFAFAAAPCAAQETVGDYQKLAQQKAQAGDYQGAIDIYDAILKQFPTKFVTFYLERATLHEQLMDWTAAIADYDAILKYDSTDPAKAMLNRPRVYGERGKDKNLAVDFPGAISDLTAAMSADPALAKYTPEELGELHKQRAMARAANEDRRGAIKDYDAALAVKPDDVSMLGARAKLKREIRDYDGAIADYTAAIAKDDPDTIATVAYRERGIARMCKGDRDGALADFEKDISLSLQLDQLGDHPAVVHPTHLLIWVLRTRAGDKEKADAELSAYLGVAKRYEEPDSNYEIANYFLGKAPESLLLDEAGKIDSHGGDAARSSVLYFIGLKRLLDGDAESALAHFNSVVKSATPAQYMVELARAEAGRITASNAKGKAK